MHFLSSLLYFLLLFFSFPSAVLAESSVSCNQQNTCIQWSSQHLSPLPSSTCDKGCVYRICLTIDKSKAGCAMGDDDPDVCMQNASSCPSSPSLATLWTTDAADTQMQVDDSRSEAVTYCQQGMPGDTLVFAVREYGKICSDSLNTVYHFGSGGIPVTCNTKIEGMAGRCVTGDGECYWNITVPACPSSSSPTPSTKPSPSPLPSASPIGTVICEWGAWGDCSATCGGGIRQQYWQCTDRGNPFPCSGPQCGQAQTMPCNTNSCVAADTFVYSSEANKWFDVLNGSFVTGQLITLLVDPNNIDGDHRPKAPPPYFFHRAPENVTVSGRSVSASQGSCATWASAMIQPVVRASSYGDQWLFVVSSDISAHMQCCFESSVGWVSYGDPLWISTPSTVPSTSFPVWMWAAVAIGIIVLLISLAVLCYRISRPQTDETMLSIEPDAPSCIAFHMDPPPLVANSPTGYELEAIRSPSVLQRPVANSPINRLRARRPTGDINTLEMYPAFWGDDLKKVCVPSPRGPMFDSSNIAASP